MISKWYFADDLTTGALFLELLVGGVIVVFAGSRLTRIVDQLGDRLGLGKAWAGLLLLATVTSLPEVVASGTAVAVGNADMAFATIFGSCSFNIVLIVVLNAVMGGGSILRSASPGHSLTSSFGVVLTTLAVLGILLQEKFSGSPRLAQFYELLLASLIIGLYLSFVRLVYRYERSQASAVAPAAAGRQRAVGAGLYAAFATVSAVLVVSAWWMAQTGDVVSGHHIELLGRPLGATVVGAMFLAIATSLPEISTGVAAVRLGQLDLALGNIFGSNMFNIFVIPFMKIVSLFYGDHLLMSGPNFDPIQNTLAGLLPILLTGIAVGGLIYRTRRRLLRRFGFDSGMILLAYGAGMWVLLSG